MTVEPGAVGGLRAAEAYEPAPGAAMRALFQAVREHYGQQVEG
jgi:hypothetical protein